MWEKPAPSTRSGGSGGGRRGPGRWAEAFHARRRAHTRRRTHARTHERWQSATALRWAVSVKKLRRADGRAPRLECSELAGAWGPACFHREHLGSPPLELAPCQATSGSRWRRPRRPLTPLRILRLCLSDRCSRPSSVCPRVSESARNPGGRGCSLSGQTASLLAVCGRDGRFPRARRSQLRQARCVRGGHAVPPEALGAGTTRRAGPRAARRAERHGPSSPTPRPVSRPLSPPRSRAALGAGSATVRPQTRRRSRGSRGEGPASSRVSARDVPELRHGGC